MQAINRLSASYLWDGLILSLSLCFVLFCFLTQTTKGRGAIVVLGDDQTLVVVCHQCHIYTQQWETP